MSLPKSGQVHHYAGLRVCILAQWDSKPSPKTSRPRKPPRTVLSESEAFCLRTGAAGGFICCSAPSKEEQVEGRRRVLLQPVTFWMHLDSEGCLSIVRSLVVAGGLAASRPAQGTPLSSLLFLASCRNTSGADTRATLLFAEIDIIIIIK